MSQDSQDLHDRVTEILNAAETSSGAMLGDSDEDGDSDGADLFEAAREASDLLEDAEPDELLAAVGLDTLPDGSEPDSIPEAIARGDPEQVAELQRLLHLSNLADGDGDADEGALEGAVDELRESIGDGEEDTATDDGEREDEGAETAEGEAAEDADETADGDEDDGLLDIDLGSSDEEREADEGATAADEGDESGAREAVASAAETVSEASGLDGIIGDDGDTEGEAETDGDESIDGAEADDEGSDIGDRLRSAVESSLTDVGDDLEGLKDQLQDRSASSVGGADSEDDTADDEAEDEENGLLGTDLGSGDEGSSAGGDGTRHSTMAPPPSDRADMGRSTRHSTMPKRH